MNWAPVAEKLIGLLEKFGGPIGAWIAGYMTGKRKAKRKQEKADAKAVEQTLEDEREIHRRRNDRDERDRVLQDYTRPKPPDDTQ